MATVVNLKARRKAAARDAKRAAGTVAAARSGLGKAEKARLAAEAAKAARDLDGKRRE